MNTSGKCFWKKNAQLLKYNNLIKEVLMFFKWGKQHNPKLPQPYVMTSINDIVSILSP